ncbi:hypothetical protein L208DRAFT_259573 [Tricholoma matsutake]|nr:hypothetical protein L208DRAFT_259573 [Tricholoma matsutake 945]
MSYKIQDGRYYAGCGHFYAMATRVQDCLQQNCLFSGRHVHIGCRSTNCIRLMAQPVHNPIRMSPSICGDCTTMKREGPLGFQ